MTSCNDKEHFPFQNVLIVGLGVMGGSFCKQIATSNANIFIIEIDEKTKKLAKIDNPQLNFISFADITILKSIDFVIVTMMPTAVPDIFEKLATTLSPQTIVIDISGIKEKLVAKLQENHYPFQYALTHPMAGREKGGYLSSDATIFQNCNYLVITDIMQLSTKAKKQLEMFIHFLGTQRIFYMTSREHDLHITYTSQLSHVLASSLLTSSDYSTHTAETIGDSFRDLTRIANMNIPMWSHLFVENKENLTATIAHLIAELLKMKTSIEQDDMEALQTQLAVAKQRRQLF